MRPSNLPLTRPELSHLLKSITPYIRLYPQSNEQVLHLVKPNFPFVSLFEEVESALEKMTHKDLSILPVVDDNKMFWGIITKTQCQEVLKRTAQIGHAPITIKTILPKPNPLETPKIFPETKIQSAVEIFDSCNTNHLAVVDYFNRYLGMLSRADIVSHLLESNALSDFEDRSFFDKPF